MDRRALSLIAALGFALGAPAASIAAAPDADALLAQSQTGTLTSDGIAAGEDTGTLTKDPKAAGQAKDKANGTSGGQDDAKASSGASVADQLPLTGSDPRITLLLGIAALLAGAGMRLRTGDVRDF